MRSERFRGTLVRGADFDEMRESYELRATIETRALSLAAPYPAPLIADLEQLLDQMTAAIESAEFERYIDCAMRFHRRLIEGSGNRAFLGVWDSLLWDVRGRIVLHRFAETGRGFSPLLQAHRALLARLHAQDAAGAADQLRAMLDLVCSAFAPE